MKYIYYKTDGTHEIVESEKPLEYERLTDFVGGLIEFAPEEADGSVPMVNEEGLLNMLPRNPFFKPAHQDYYAGNVLLGKNVIGADGREFHGFDDEEIEKFIRKPIAYEQSMFKKGKVYTVISIADFMAHTTRNVIRATGEMYMGAPAFVDNERGAKMKYLLPNLDSSETLLFEGDTVPFTIDGEIETEEARKARTNGLINLCGDKEVIMEYVENHNKNPFFNAFDRINHIDGDIETLIYPHAPTHSKVILDRQIAERG